MAKTPTATMQRVVPYLCYEGPFDPETCSARADRAFGVTARPLVGDAVYGFRAPSRRRCYRRGRAIPPRRGSRGCRPCSAAAAPPARGSRRGAGW